MAVTAPEKPITNIHELAAALGLDDAVVVKVRALINNYRDFFAETMARPTRDGGPSPALRFVEASRSGHPSPLEEMTAHAVAAIEPRSERPYLEVIGMHEYGVRQAIGETLPPEARERWRSLSEISLLNIQTGYDPFQELLSQTLNAVINGSYTPPELRVEETSKYKEFFCPAPFEFATVDHSGQVYMCCPAWLPKSAGNLAEQPWEEVWNSKTAQDIRASILDASFKYCNEGNCPHLRGQNGRLVRKCDVTNPRHREIIEKNIVVMEEGPLNVTIQYDPTCNLTCPSCRCDMYKATKEESTTTKAAHERVWTELVGSAKRLTIAGNGDPFASKLYRDALRAFDPAKYPDLKIALITNGLLLTPEMWESISNCHSAIESIHVSFNAATPETFRVNQRGGEMDKLLENLGPLSWARHAGEFPLLSLGFYVLDNNFREMKEIIAIGKKYKVDRVLFGHFMPPPYMVGDDDRYRALAVHMEGHPDHEELLEILGDPIFLDPLVAMTNLTPLMPGFRPHVDREIDYRDQMTLQELNDFIGMDATQSAFVTKLLWRLSKDFSALMFARTGSDAVSPGHFLAGLMEPGVELPTTEQLAAFEEYAANTMEPNAATTYANVARDFERALRRDLLARLEPAQRQKLALLPVRSLLDIVETRSLFLARVRATTERSLAAH